MEKIMTTKNGTTLWYNRSTKQYQTDNWNDVENALNEDINGTDEHAAQLATDILNDIVMCERAQDIC
jgi:hypothetical protein